MGRRVAIGACLLLAVGLRFAALDAGLPHVLGVDEPSYAVPARRVSREEPRPPRRWAPAGFTYAIVALRETVERVPGLDARLAALVDGDDAARHALLGRVVSALAGVAVVAAGAWVAGTVAGGAAAVAAALLLAVELLGVRQARMGTPDVAMLAAWMLSVGAALRAARSDRLRDLAVAGALAGLATVFKLPGAVASLAPAAAVLLDRGRPPGGRAVRLALVLAAMTTAFVAVDPFALIEPRRFLAGSRAIIGHAAGTVEGQPLAAVPLVYAGALAYGLGPVLALALLGLAWLGRGRAPHARDAVIVLASPLAYALVMTTKPSVYVRYAVPLAAFACLFAALGVAWIAGRRSRLAALVLVLAAGWPAAHALCFVALETRADTRELAIAWLDEHVDPGTPVLLDAVSAWMPGRFPGPPPHTMYMHRELASLRELGRRLGRPPEYLVVEGWIEEMWDPARVRVRREDPAARPFYAVLEQRFERVATFSPGPEPPFHFERLFAPWDGLWGLERPGPEVRVYRLER